MMGLLGDATGDRDTRARLSGGTSDAAIYALVLQALQGQRVRRLLDVGCGRGELWPLVRGLAAGYVGIDAVAYDGYPRAVRLIRADLDEPLPLPDAVADAVVSVETIEHLENPRAFMRELARVAEPGGLVIVTTPNQLSALSLLTLLARQRFASFQDVDYPAHRTALLEVDLRRIAAEAGLAEARVVYSLAGRMPLSVRRYPRSVARLSPRLFSDNVMLCARRPRQS